jgi:hypothetical protein
MAGSDPKPAGLRMLRFEIAMAPGASAHWRTYAFRIINPNLNEKARR